ncbi:MAG TPA: glycosyl hydrolase family 65 protein [Actinomycetales bacterium]|nr:glycosyl hydrolase family 65 protein [Actinomycetales bacterium]
MGRHDLPDITAAAVVFDWDGTAVPDRHSSAGAVRRRVERLCSLGVHVAVVSGTHVQNVDGQLRARPSGPGRLLLATNRGSELFEVEPGGPVLRERRWASPLEDAGLDKAAADLRQQLSAVGLHTDVVTRLNRRKIDLIPDPDWADPPKARLTELLVAVTRRLADAGLADLKDVVCRATSAAVGAGLADPRVTSDAKHVEIGLTDKSDAMRRLLRELWQVGVGPGLVIVVGDEFGSLGGAAGSDSFLLVSRARRATVVSVGAEPCGVPPGVTHLAGGPATFLALLDDQLARHRHRRVPGVDRDERWTITQAGDDPVRLRVLETLFTLGAGGLAVRGALDAPSVPVLRAAGVYHQQGSAQRLLPGPDWTHVRLRPRPKEVVQVLDLRTGVLLREERELADVGRPVRSLRFVSAARPGTMGLRVEAAAHRLAPGTVFRAPEGLPMAQGRVGGQRWARVASDLGGGMGAVAQQAVSQDGDLRCVERLVVVTSHRRRQPDLGLDAASDAVRHGFSPLLAAHRAAWARRWSSAGASLPDDPQLERALRFALFHLWGAIADADELAVGARGLSGPGYSGHVFWDADVFVLPAVATIDPAAARAMVRYRLHRLDPARARARAEGRHGARFPWESAASGDDVTPPTVRFGAEPTPVMSGRQEEHITAAVAWGVLREAAWGGRRLQPGSAELALLRDTARYWVSRCTVDADGAAHITGVVGPDEYHEAVDDNAFTNVMARWNLRAAAAAVSRRAASPDEARSWLALADALVDGLDASTGLYEQFRGYHALAPVLAADLAAPPYAADVLFGRQRIAATQVIKQPDVLMLHHLVPDEVAAGSLLPNLAYYGPRTSHGSSLSPAIMASLLARAGSPDEALSFLRMAAQIDLADAHGMSAAGLHLAAMGGAWQAVLMGFLGARVRSGTLLIDPVLPADWGSFEVRFRCLGHQLRVRVDRQSTEVNVEGRLRVGVGRRPPRSVTGTFVVDTTVGRRDSSRRGAEEAPCRT